MRVSKRLIAIVLLVLVCGLSAIMLSRPALDADTLALAHERALRLAAFRADTPVLNKISSAPSLDARLKAVGFKLGSPIFVRIYKRSFELEVWIKRDGLFERFATYPICYFSGGLGPKLSTGDRQSPEGIYSVETRQLNPRSRWHKAFNLGFPNRYDQAHGRTGSFLMVHGGCSSVGCYAMTNPAVDDIYKLARAALRGGQAHFQVQALPFRMTPQDLALRASHKYAAFWAELKAVSDAFDATKLPPDVAVCDGHYKVIDTKLAAGADSECGRL